MTLATVPLNLVEVGDRLRSINEDHVAAVAASIAEVGLLNPITVFRKRVLHANIFVEGYGVIAGAHRVEAVRRLGHTDVAAQVMELSDLQRQLAECDENLCSTKLTPSERALFTQRRKDAYEALHPETRAHVAGAHAANASMGNASAKLAPAFTADTAAKTGRSERDVQRDAERGKRIDDSLLQEIKGTALDKGTVLDELAHTPKAEQAAKVQELATERAERKASRSTAIPVMMALPCALAAREAAVMESDADPDAPYEPYELERRVAEMMQAVLNAVYGYALDPDEQHHAAVYAALGGTKYMSAVEEWSKAQAAWSRKRTRAGAKPQPPAIPDYNG